MFPPTVIIDSFCLILNATCFCAFLFVARIANRSEHITSQGGTAMSKRSPRTMCLKNPTMMQMCRFTKGIGLVTKLVEQDVGCTTVVAGWIIEQAQISEVTRTKTVRGPKEKSTVRNNLNLTFPSHPPNSSLKLKLRPTPGSIMCAVTEIEKVKQVINIEIPLKAVSNSFS